MYRKQPWRCLPLHFLSTLREITVLFLYAYWFRAAFYNTIDILNTAPLFSVRETAAIRSDHCNRPWEEIPVLPKQLSVWLKWISVPEQFSMRAFLKQSPIWLAAQVRTPKDMSLFSTVHKFSRQPHLNYGIGGESCGASLVTSSAGPAEPGRVFGGRKPFQSLCTSAGRWWCQLLR